MSCGGCRKDVQNPKASKSAYDEHMRTAKALMVTLRRPEDREYLEKLLRNSQKLNDSAIPEVKRNNEKFLSYMLKLLQRNCATQPLEIYEQWYGQGSNRSSLKKSRKASLWLEENKSYFFMEKTADGGILFYTAIATDPEAGWDKGGLKNL